MQEQFGFKERLAHLALEIPFFDQGLQRRADNFITTTDIENYLKKDGQYLDVGTGRGHIVQRILEDMGKKGNPLKGYYGIDVGDKPHRRVQRRERERQTKAAPELEEEKKVSIGQKNPMGFSWATAEKLPFADKSFDGVSLFFSIHHMDKDKMDEVFRKVKQVIKEDGYIFVAEDIPESEDERKFTEKIDRLNNLESKNAEHYYESDQKWKEYFERMGLEVVNQKFFETQYKKGAVKHGFYLLKLKQS